MTLLTGPERTNRLDTVLDGIRDKGIKLWSENGQLRYQAPKGVLTPLDLETLRLSKQEILAYLENSGTTPIPLAGVGSPSKLAEAPLTFSQLEYWHFLHSGKRPTTSLVASATRLQGRLNLEALRISLAELVHRHDALRTRIVVCDGVPVQKIAPAGHCDLKIDDLTAVSHGGLDEELRRLIDAALVEPVDLATGPLFGVRLLKVGDAEHIMLVTLEHMISDAFSMSLLLRDLLTLYRQALNGDHFMLPPIPVQFPNYALAQRTTHQAWMNKHGAYWQERLSGDPRLKFPGDRNPETVRAVGWGTVPVRFGRSVTAELRDACRLRCTTVAMSVFTAYVALVLRWCNASQGIFQYLSDGRGDPDIENTIGYFAAVLYVHIELLESDRFSDLTQRLTEEYCRAYEHADAAYLAAQVPRPQFARNTVFNWVPQRSDTGLGTLHGSGDALIATPFQFANPGPRDLEYDNEPMIVLFDTGDEIVGSIRFPRNRFSTSMMERFERNFVAFTRAVLGRSEQRLRHIPLL